MQLLALLFQPGVIGLVALFLSVLWMLRDETDRTRPLLVFALVLNLFFGTLMTFTMAREGALLPYKYDHVLLCMDRSLGISAAAIAAPLQGFCRIPLLVIYMSMVPMMITWVLVSRCENHRRVILAAYIAELVTGPLAYLLLPGCGPIYAFRSQWLHPPAVQPEAIKLIGMPNAFPSLHMGTAFALVLLASRWHWRAVALLFLVGTALATLSTGEHYVIDLVSGLAFGCFAACVGYKEVRGACFYLAVVVCWSLSVRFSYGALIDHPALLRTAATMTLATALYAVRKAWRVPTTRLAARPAAVSL